METKIECFELLVNRGIQNPIQVTIDVFFSVLVMYGYLFSVRFQLESFYPSEFFDRYLERNEGSEKLGSKYDESREKDILLGKLFPCLLPHCRRTLTILSVQQ